MRISRIVAVTFQEHRPAGSRGEHVHHGVVLENGTCLCTDFDHAHRHDHDEKEHERAHETHRNESQELHEERQRRLRCEFSRKSAALRYRKEEREKRHLSPPVLALVVLGSAAGGALVAVVIMKLSKRRQQQLERDIHFATQHVESNAVDDTKGEDGMAVESPKPDAISTSSREESVNEQTEKQRSRSGSHVSFASTAKSE